MNRLRTKLPWCWGCLLGSREESAHLLSATKKLKQPRLHAILTMQAPHLHFPQLRERLTFDQSKTETSCARFPFIGYRYSEAPDFWEITGFSQDPRTWRSYQGCVEILTLLIRYGKYSILKCHYLNGFKMYWDKKMLNVDWCNWGDPQTGTVNCWIKERRDGCKTRVCSTRLRSSKLKWH
jgi:hypothetical protein